MKNRKKEIILLVIAILVIVSMTAGATYAFFKAQTGPAANFDINATTSTTDNLTFSTEGDIVLNVTAENLKKSGGDLSDTAIARARLIANNSSNSATAYYNVYLLIEENEMEYSSYTKEGQSNLEFMNKEKKEETDLTGYIGVPELILSVKKGNKEQEITKRLTPTDGGYDITEADGLYAIGENVEIISDGDVTDEWEVKVTFKNLEYNQQLNTGKSLKGKIIITAEKLLYEINDAAGLRQLSSEVNNGDTKEGKYYILTNNIDLGPHEEGISNFIPIGNYTNQFQGNFNGDNHIISNLYINNEIEGSDLRLGLFGSLTNASLSNLEVSGNVASKVTAVIGGIIGSTQGIINIKNVTNKVNVTSESNSFDAAGIIGANHGTVLIKNSQNYGNIEGSANAGGIIGYNNVNLTIENCINYGQITNNLGAFVGGLIGRNSTDSSIVKITKSANEGKVEGMNNTGGIIGQTTGKIEIIDSHNSGDITNNKGNYTGGLIGSDLNNNCETLIENSYNAGNVKGNSNLVVTYVGGIIGYTNGNIEINNSHNIGNVTSNGEKCVVIGGLIAYAQKKVIINSSYNSNNKIEINPNGFNAWGLNGGLIGWLYNKDEISIIKNSYNTGEIINGTRVGGTIGHLSSGIIMDKCYNAGNINVKNEKWTDGTHVGGLVSNANGFYFVTKQDIIINSFNSGNIIIYDNNSTTINGIVSSSWSKNLILLNSYNVGNINLQSNSSRDRSSGVINSSSRNSQSTANNINILNNVYNLGKIIGTEPQKYSFGYFDPNTTTNDIKNVYYLDYDNIPGSNVISYGMSKTIEQMKSQSFVDELNNNIKSINLEEIDPLLKDYTLVNWKLGEDGYPTLDF